MLDTPVPVKEPVLPGGPRHSRNSESPLSISLAPVAIALLAVLAGTAGGLSTVLSAPALRCFLLLLFVLTGVGCAILCWLELPTGAAVAGIVGLSLAAAIVVGTAGAWLHAWYPIASCLAVSLIVLSSGLIRLWTLIRPMRFSSLKVSRGLSTSARHAALSPVRGYRFADVWAKARSSTDSLRSVLTGQVSAIVATTLSITAVMVCIAALPTLRSEKAGEYGLLATTGGFLLIGATVCALTGFLVAVTTSRMASAVLAIVAVIFVARVTVPLITEAPNYVWTYKHIGVVDYITKTGSLPSLPFDIYGPWPGFFAGAAWFTSVAHVDPVTLAQWFAPLIDALATVLVVALALALRMSLRTALVAALIAQVLNWVGQDYFSPQGIAFVLAISILALLAYSRIWPTASYVSLPIFATLVPTHQLTPIWVCAVAIAFGLFGLIRPRGLALMYVALLATYVFSRRNVIDQYGWLSGFNPFANSETVVNNPGSAGRIFTTTVEQALAVSVWLLAALCFLVFWRKNAARWTAGILAFSSMMLLFAQNYGGEAIFRVYLFSLPGCAVLLAGFLAMILSLRSFRLRMVGLSGTWLVIVTFAVAGLQGYFGSWSYVTITRAQLALSRQLLATNSSDTLVALPAPAGLPTRVSGEYVRHAEVDPWYDDQPDALEDAMRTGAPPLPETMEWLEADIRSSPHRRLFLVLPQQVWAYDEYTNYYKPGALQMLVEQLNSRPGWTTVSNDADTLVFVYNG